jgi:hypothetical protein
MTMYTKLLEAALDSFQDVNSSMTSGEILADLLYRRSFLEGNLPRAGPDTALTSVADQLGYDVLLIELGRRHGVRCDLEDFDNLPRGRTRLEETLQSRGLPLT